MKKIFSFFTVALLIGVAAMVGSCSQEEIVSESEPETGGWHSAKVRLNIDCSGFETNGDGTRAASDAWQDGDVVSPAY